LFAQQRMVRESCSRNNEWFVSLVRATTNGS
jgi:hypothetical protein